MKLLKSLILALLFMPFSSHAEELSVGSTAPTPTGINQDGVEVNFAQVFKDNKYVLIYFYPKADTPGCTAQACSIRDSFEALQKLGVVVYGVSSDSTKAQKEFQKKYKLPFNLIADEKKNVIKAFGVPSLLGFAKRQAFLVKDGKIVWLDREASTKEQAQDILKYLEQDKTEGKK
jgi:thioredoxin-dependent peroxiredoxin